LVTALSAWTGIVEYAYTAPVLADPIVVGAGNPYFPDQGYLAAAPIGVGAEAAGARGADGSGLRFVDVEQGWLLSHEDLPFIPVLAGISGGPNIAHGTSVLGIISAIDDDLNGICGIAPEAVARVVSYRDPPPEAGDLLPCRLLRAARALDFGDVLLIEVDGEIHDTGIRLPIEIEPPVFEAIRLITSAGIVVVEPAGNGAQNLNETRFPPGAPPVLDRNVPATFKDSGAIVVGACTSASPHHRLGFSNFGSRLDTWAWGEDVTTTGDRDRPNQRDAYWHAFGGTSAASAIITGVCLLIQHLQGLLQPLPGRPTGRLNSMQMRDLLNNLFNGTPVVGGPLGEPDTNESRAMPDLGKIIANEFVS
jgi:hypothetical protein